MHKSTVTKFGCALTLSSLVVICMMWGRASGAAFASAAANIPDLCVAAASFAASQTDTPLAVLMAITLTETGRTTDGRLRPWPWAINQGGKSYWFATSGEAAKFAENQLDLGLRNFDVGCFQLNHRWHSKGFLSTSDMFDPNRNAVYAAQFLGELYLEKGDWSLAAAAYHSRTPEFAEEYKAKFETILAGLSDSTLPGKDAEMLSGHTNKFPLLQAGLKGNAGSIVPRFSNQGPLIGGQP